MSPRASLITTALSALAIMSASAPAMAGAQETRSVEVRYDDLNLASEAGAKRLQGRIKAAARTVCSPMPSRALADQLDYKKCFSQAVSGGSKAAVTILAKAKSGQEFASRDLRIVVSN
ncbi:UrcA family protein [Sphingorhabdus sp. Alg239-R122]|uniref:UrcA family protein n=1 Tax=Sphingorhabdus sp. Alg239-R122 TaxID=2305989 RepID=UPI0013DA2972|nr:UrcA family protein [Sphingorhabdus sp. Alg239-R122]